MELTVVERIVMAIADAEETSTENLDIVLQRWIDTDAVRQLVAHGRESWEIQFAVKEHTVTITGDEVVLVDGVRQRNLF